MTIRGFWCFVRGAGCALLLSAPGWGQTTAANWYYSSGASGPIYYNGGGVGIGTVSPGFKLDLQSADAVTTGNHSIAWMARASTSESGVIVGYHSNGSFADYPIVRAGGLAATGLALAGDSQDQTALFIKVGGNVGIGTTNPGTNLDVAGPVRAYGDYLQAGTGNVDANLGPSVAIGYNTTNNYGTIDAAIWGTGGKPLLLQALSGGNVGIGTTNPQSKLAVNGTITTQEVVVTATGWSDYVFDQDNQLAPLTEVASFIEENHHLPGIPSAAEVAEKGVSVGEMQAKLLAKVEELTLHLIQDEKKIAALESAAQAKREPVKRHSFR